MEFTIRSVLINLEAHTLLRLDDRLPQRLRAKGRKINMPD